VLHQPNVFLPLGRHPPLNEHFVVISQHLLLRSNRNEHVENHMHWLSLFYLNRGSERRNLLETTFYFSGFVDLATRASMIYLTQLDFLSNSHKILTSVPNLILVTDCRDLYKIHQGASLPQLSKLKRQVQLAGKTFTPSHPQSWHFTPLSRSAASKLITPTSASLSS
jgi:hypothetical protein